MSSRRGPSTSKENSAPVDFYLRRAVDGDLARLHGLMTIPEVYHYLADNTEPPGSVLEDWIAKSNSDFQDYGVGLWLLEGAGPLAGCVLLEVDGAKKSAELTYALDPRHWGLGAATRMGWTALRCAFGAGRINEVIAGADVPNTASIEVMRRLGMRFLREVTYSLHPGVEYVARPGDPPPDPVPDPIRIEPLSN